MAQERIDPNCLSPEDERILLNAGQVICLAHPEKGSDLPVDPSGAPGAPLTEYVAEEADVQVTDRGRGLRVLELRGRPNQAFLFGSKFGRSPELLLRNGLAWPALIPATDYVGNCRYLPRPVDGFGLAEVVLLVSGYVPNDTCNGSFGELLKEVGIFIESVREAQLLLAIRTQLSAFECEAYPQFETPEAVFEANRRAWEVRRSF